MRRLHALLATLLLAATLVGVASVPGHAAACAQGTGLTVVVEGASGGTRCVGDAHRTVWSATEAAGHSLTPVTRSPGAVCRVNGFPSSADEKCIVMPPPDAYWALFHADGRGGGWTYAQQGAGSLRLPAGSWVAWVFQGANARTNPRATPLGPAPSTPKPVASPGPSSTPSSGSTPAPAQPSAPSSAQSSAQPTEQSGPTAADSPAPTASTPAAGPASGSASGSGTVSAEPEEAVTGDAAGPPLELVLGALLVLALGTGAVVVARRHR